MFGFQNVVIISAPTGNAAFGADGETINRAFSCGIGITIQKLGEKSEEKLLKKLKTTLVLIFDEWSLISTKILAEAENHIRQTSHGGTQTITTWGVIPIVIVCGDDAQLYAIGRNVLRLQFKICEKDPKMDYKNAKPPNNPEEILGAKLWWELSSDVMELKKVARTNENQQKYLEIQNKTRDDKLNINDFNHLVKYHIHKGEFTEQQKQEILKDAMFVFANKEPRNELNRKRIVNLSSPENPIAIIQSYSCGRRAGKPMAISGHFQADMKISNKTILCRDAMVAIEARNFQPS